MLPCSLCLPLFHRNTVIVKTFFATARDREREEGAELIKVRFDTQGDILLSNHDRGSQLHTVSLLLPSRPIRVSSSTLGAVQNPSEST